MITTWFPDDPLYNRYYPDNPAYRHYFEFEWGVPSHDDAQLFEMLSLSGFAAGLNWRSVLNKRAAFRRAFANWQLERIIDLDVTSLQNDPTIIRNHRKIQAVRHNAQLVLAIQRHQTFDQYLWQQIGYQQHRLIVSRYADLPRTSAVGDQLAATLKQAGFQFVGPVTVHAWLVTVGLIHARPDQRGLVRPRPGKTNLPT